MSIRRYSCLLFLLVAALAPEGAAQTVSRVGTTAGAFLKIPVGARALGMGQAYVTEARDITAMFWNPAGLAEMQQGQIVLNHYDYIADINFEYGGIAVPVRNIGTFGFNLTYLGAPDLERTTLTFQNGSGEKVSAGFLAAGLSYARAITDRFSIGFNGKYIRESLWNSTATGFALDVGILYRSQFKNVQLGMVVANYGSKLQLDGRDLLVQHDISIQHGNNDQINAALGVEAYNLPIYFRVGLSMNLTRDILGLSDRHNFIFAVNAVHPNDDKEYLNVGAEYNFAKHLALRAGYRNVFLEDAEGGLAFGFGLAYDFSGLGVALDYAAVDFGRLDYVNKFTLILSF